MRCRPVIFALVLLAAGSGCSRYTLKSAPIWDAEAHKPNGPVEDRVNVWPLLYWRDPVLSVLWPLYTATDQGNALAPLYEYRRDEQTLRLGSIHPELPSLATFNGADRYSRVLNVVVDRKHKTIGVIPLYDQRFGNKWFVLVLPVYFQNKNGFWTPLVTWRKNTKGVLGPLFFRHADYDQSVSYAFPWPVAGYSHGKDERDCWVWPLFGFGKNKDDRFAWALSFLFGRVRDGRFGSSWMIPFWYYGEPCADASTFLSLPYSRIHDGYDEYRCWFGLVHQWRDSDTTGQAAVPLYISKRTTEGVRSFYSLPVSYRSDGSMIATPLYSRYRKNGSGFDNVGVVLYHRSVNAETTTVTHNVLASIVQWKNGSTPEKHSWRVFPFVRYKSNNHHRTFKTLLASVDRTRYTDDQLRGKIHRDAENNRNCVHYVYNNTWKFERKAINNRYLLQLAGHSRKITASGPDLDIDGLVFHETYESWFFPFFNNRSDGETARFNILFRLYDSVEKDVDGSPYARKRVLWRLYHRETLGAKTSVDVFPFITWDKDEKAGTSKFSFCWRLFANEKKGDQRKTWVMFVPVGGNRKE